MRKITINLNHVAHNLSSFRKLVNSTSKTVKIMGVVKADAYGHGMVEVARKIESEGVDYIGVADLAEAQTLRAAGITSRILAWLHDPEDDFVAAIKHDIDVAVFFPELNAEKSYTFAKVKCSCFEMIFI